MFSDLLTVQVSMEWLQIYSLFIIFLWVLNGIFLAKDFIRFQSACERYKLDDVDVFLHPTENYPEEVRKAVRRAWKSLIIWGVITGILLIGC